MSALSSFSTPPRKAPPRKRSFFGVLTLRVVRVVRVVRCVVFLGFFGFLGFLSFWELRVDLLCLLAWRREADPNRCGWRGFLRLTLLDFNPTGLFETRSIATC
jgi:hypothetical protein